MLKMKMKKKYVEPVMKKTNINVPYNIMWNSVPDFGPGYEDDDVKERNDEKEWGEVNSSLW